MILGLTWGEWASITTIIVFLAGLVSLLFKYVILGSFQNDIKELNQNFSMLNNNLSILKRDIDKLDNRADEHDRRLDRHHERIKDLKEQIK
jgi:peptidoglycan hydrolase CwlO-like protein